MGQFRSTLRNILISCRKSGDFELSSGNKADDYFDLAPLLLNSIGLRMVSWEVRDALRNVDFDALGCLELCPAPLVGAILCKAPSYMRGFVVRKAQKGYGTNKLIEGDLRSGDKVVVLEDVTSTGQSVLRVVRAVEEFGCKVVCILTIINRQEGCDGLLKDYNFRWLFKKGEL